MLKRSNVSKWLFCVAMFVMLASCSSTRNIPYYQKIMDSEGYEYIEFRCRVAILDFIENIRSAYNRKDIDMLAKVYSNNALIYNPEKQTTQTKKKYIKYLRSVFEKNANINVNFDNIKVVCSPKFPNIYGIRLFQGWNTTNYSDVGCLFLMIDFKDGKNMQILQRTWQPENLKGEPLSEEEKFKLGDFDILTNNYTD